MIYFGSSRADTEAYIGAAGEPVGASEISGEGWTDTYETYHYSMHWFDSKVPMSTYYQYRNGFLERIELRPEETGYTGEQVRELIEAMYGSPVSEEGDRPAGPTPFTANISRCPVTRRGVSLRWEITPWASPMCWPPIR